MKHTPTLSSRFGEYIPKLQRFFEGNLYPTLIAALVLLGHVSGLEFFLVIPILLSSALAFFVCETSKPFIPIVLTIVYIINLKHTPGYPTNSDYYTQPYIIVTIVILLAILLSSIIFFTAKRVIPKIHPKQAPLFLPLVLLSAAFVLNGFLSENWKFANVIFGIGEVAVFFLLFYIFYYGLEAENVNKLIDYVCYVSLLTAIVLISEVGFMYLTSEVLFNSDGSIIKDNLSLGWGVSNPAGNALVVLIAPIMLGAVKCKYSSVYPVVAILTCGAVFLTFSRNAIILAILVFTASFITVYLMSEDKKNLLIVLGCGIAAALLLMLIFKDRVSELLIHFSKFGTGDSGRFKLWRESFKNFLSAPIFGIGFFDWGDMTSKEMASFVPTMSHNTFFQLISSMGIFGLGAYVFYRVKTLLPFFKRISREKLMILYSILALLLGSLLDNFIFYFHSAFLYILLLAVVFIMNDYEEKWIKEHAYDSDDWDEDEDESDEKEDDDDYYI